MFIHPVLRCGIRPRWIIAVIVSYFLVNIGVRSIVIAGKFPLDQPRPLPLLLPVESLPLPLFCHWPLSLGEFHFPLACEALGAWGLIPSVVRLPVVIVILLAFTFLSFIGLFILAFAPFTFRGWRFFGSVLLFVFLFLSAVWLNMPFNAAIMAVESGVVFGHEGSAVFIVGVFCFISVIFHGSQYDFFVNNRFFDSQNGVVTGASKKNPFSCIVEVCLKTVGKSIDPC